MRVAAATVLPLLAALVLVLPGSLAQSHEHTGAGTGGPIAVVTDLAPDGMALVGTPAHFAVVAFGDDLDPDFHQNIPLRVLLDDKILWQTTPASGHDYDGMADLDIVFPHPGTWRVEALDDSGNVLAHREGTAVAHVTENSVQLEAGWTQNGGTLDLEYGLYGEDRALLNHTDVLLEAYRDGLLVFRTHTHTHTDLQAARLNFIEPGDYVLRQIGYQAYPTATGPAFAPVISEIPFTVATPTPPALAAPPIPVASAELNRVTHGQGADASDGRLQLIGTLDPYVIVGPATLQHLNVLVVDPATGTTAQHVNFQAELVGPLGVLFSSDSLHEYDGIYTLATQQTIPGAYELRVRADRGDWSDTITLSYLVAPPVAATVLGPQILTLEAPTLTEGHATNIRLAATGITGQPFAHGELEIDLRDARGLPLLHSKLHAHDDGTFPATLALPPGDHDLSVTPFPLLPQPVTGYFQDNLGTPLGFTLQSEPNLEESHAIDANGPGTGASIPGLGATGILALLATAALLTRRSS